MAPGSTSTEKGAVPHGQVTRKSDILSEPLPQRYTSEGNYQTLVANECHEHARTAIRPILVVVAYRRSGTTSLHPVPDDYSARGLASASRVCLRFARLQPAIVAFPPLALATYLASLIALRGVFASPEVYLFGLVGIANVLPYIVDKFLTRRLKGFVRTLVFPASYVVVDWVIGRSLSGHDRVAGVFAIWQRASHADRLDYGNLGTGVSRHVVRASRE